MVTLQPSKLGSIGQYLLRSLKVLVETGQPPTEPNAWESRQFYKKPKRSKRSPSQSQAAKQYARYYLDDKRSRDVRE